MYGYLRLFKLARLAYKIRFILSALVIVELLIRLSSKKNSKKKQQRPELPDNVVAGLEQLKSWLKNYKK